MITVEELVGAIDNENENLKTKLGTVHSFGDKGVKIIFDGEGAASEKEYESLGSSSPAIGDRVLLLSVSGTWIILGNIGIPVGQFKINGEFQQKGGDVAFFGKAPHRQRSTSVLPRNASLSDVITKVNWLRTFLKDFGFIE